ncbi:MAG: S-methyl-5'-thioinosine phosphorylase [Chromatiales bacterium]
MTELAIIGGSGFTQLEGLEIIRREVVHTPFGEASAPLTHGILNGHRVVFLPRHGAGHTISPHEINYRANIWALHNIGVRRVVAMAAVGGITGRMGPGSIAVPDQIIDYTYGRDHTFFESDLTQVTHIEFSEPYCEELRKRLLAAAEGAGVVVVAGGTYAATQGPRLETAMEVKRLEKDGCDLVGMTGMPEAALARELDLCYAACAIVANWAAGKGEGPITMKQIEQTLAASMDRARRLLAELVTGL